jgi:hypothetical protein
LWYSWMQFWNALNSFQKVSMILWVNIVWTVRFGLGQGGTWRRATTFSIASRCSPVYRSLTSAQTDSITHNAQAAIEYSCSICCLRLFQCHAKLPDVQMTWLYYLVSLFHLHHCWVHHQYR